MPQDRLVLAAASGSANTYRVLPSGALSPAGTAAANGQEATCWLVEVRTTSATNTASDTIVAPDRALTLTATVHGLPAYDHRTA